MVSMDPWICVKCPCVATTRQRIRAIIIIPYVYCNSKKLNKPATPSVPVSAATLEFGFGLLGIWTSTGKKTKFFTFNLHSFSKATGNLSLLLSPALAAFCLRDSTEDNVDLPQCRTTLCYAALPSQVLHKDPLTLSAERGPEGTLLF